MNSLDLAYFGAVVLGILACTLITRGAFLIPKHMPPLPEKLQIALRYAPVAALAGIIAPEIFLATPTGPAWIKVSAAIAAVAWFYWRRGLLGTLLAGMAAYSLLRVAHFYNFWL